MLCSCIVTKLKNTFDSLVCEFTANVVKGGIVSRCRYNIFTIGNRSTGSSVCSSTSRTRKILAFLLLKPVYAEFSFDVLSRLFKSIALAQGHNRLRYMSCQ